MEITEVKVFPVRDKKLRAFVSIVLDGSFIVNDIKVISGKEGLFISMPSRRRKNGRFKDIAHPLNNETRQAMEARIVAEYRRVTEEGGAEAEEGGAQTAEAASDEPREQASSAPATAAEEAAASASETPEPAPPEADAGGQQETEGKSLEEVHEAHLSDSYWTT